MIDDASKAVFVAAAEQRKLRGIRLKRIGLMADQTQVEAFYLIWEGWVQRFGKEDAMDLLVATMCDMEVKLREWDAARRADKNRRRKRKV